MAYQAVPSQGSQKHSEAGQWTHTVVDEDSSPKRVPIFNLPSSRGCSDTIVIKQAHRTYSFTFPEGTPSTEVFVYQRSAVRERPHTLVNETSPPLEVPKSLPSPPLANDAALQPTSVSSVPVGISDADGEPKNISDEQGKPMDARKDEPMDISDSGSEKEEEKMDISENEDERMDID